MLGEGLAGAATEPHAVIDAASATRSGPRIASRAFTGANDTRLDASDATDK